LALVPHAEDLGVDGLVQQGGAPDSEELDLARGSAHLQRPFVGLDGAAVVVLDLIRLQKAAELLRDGDVRSLEEGSEERHALSTFFEKEGHVELDELIQRVDHLQHQGRDLTFDDADPVDGVVEVRHLLVLTFELLLQERVVDLEPVDLLHDRGILAFEGPRLIDRLVDLRL
jgi:hypothetical protein